MGKSNVDEEKTTAASYILNFYNEIAQLTHYYAQYENVMLHLASKYGDKEDKITQQEKSIVNELNENLRYYTVVTYIKYSSISAKTGEKINKKITDLHDKVKASFMVKREDIKNYVIELNGVLMGTVVKSLLENASDLMNKLYSENAKPK